MRACVTSIAATICFLTVLSVPYASAQAASPAPEAPRAKTTTAPTRLWFEPSAAGTASGFVARGRGYTARLTPSGAAMVWQDGPSVERSTLLLDFVGASPHANLEGLDRMSGKAHYYIGNDPDRWRTDVPMYGKVRSADVYRGIDAVFYADDNGRLEYDFVVAAGADPSAILLAIDGPERMALDRAGNLVMRFTGREIVQRKPLIYQEVGGIRREIDGGWRLKGRHRVGFRIGDYDRSKPLVIDPVLVYSTHLGGSSDDFGRKIAATWWGTYVVGTTTSANFPRAGADPDPYDYDAFVAAFDQAGWPVFVTYLGGHGSDSGDAIAVNPYSGLVYVAGMTEATDFPTTPGAFQPVDPNAASRNSKDAFVTVLGNWGTPLFSTYLGDTDDSYLSEDRALGIAVDAYGFIYVSGTTSSATFPVTWDAFQPSRDGWHNAFVTVLDYFAQTVLYSTYFGSGWEESAYVAVDPAGFGLVNGFVVAGTAGPGLFTTPGAVQPTIDISGAWNTDGFVARFAPWVAWYPGATLTYSTYLGGSGDDKVWDVKMDSFGNAYIAGETTSSDFPLTPWAYGRSGFMDGFVTKLDPWGSSFLYSTCLGGSGYDLAYGLAIDWQGNAYVIGMTESTDFPLFAPVQATFGGDYDVFVTKVDTAGHSLLFSTYLGGVSRDFPGGIAVDDNGNAQITGTVSAGFPVANAFQPANGGSLDAFVAKLDTNNTTADLIVTASAAPGSVSVGASVTYAIDLTNGGPATATGTVVVVVPSAGQTLTAATFGGGSVCVQTSFGMWCDIGTVLAGGHVPITVEATATAAGSISVTAYAGAREEATWPNMATATVNVTP